MSCLFYAIKCDCFLNDLATDETTGPCPLKVITAKPAGHIKYLADEVQALLQIALHGFWGYFVSFYSAARDLSRTVAFSTRRLKLPAVEGSAKLCESLIFDIGKLGIFDIVPQLGL